MADLAHIGRIAHRRSVCDIHRRTAVVMAFEAAQSFRYVASMNAIHRIIFSAGMAYCTHIAVAGTDGCTRVWNKAMAYHAIRASGMVLMKTFEISGIHLLTVTNDAPVAFRGSLQISGFIDRRIVALAALPVPGADRS